MAAFSTAHNLINFLTNIHLALSICPLQTADSQWRPEFREEGGGIGLPISDRDHCVPTNGRPQGEMNTEVLRNEQNSS